jgi:adenylate kinase
MIALEVQEEELVTRLLKRGETSGRADDVDESVIRKRIDVYNGTTTPVADFYKAQDKLNTIEGVGSVEEIFANISKGIDSL